MLTMVRRALQRGGWVALLVVSGVLIDAPAHAGALGLSYGDLVITVVFDSLQSVPGDGADWDVSQMLFHSDGRVTQVNLQAGGPLMQSGVDLDYDLGLAAHNITPCVPVKTWCVHSKAGMPGNNPLSVPSFSVLNASGVVLNGNFILPVTVEGDVNVITGQHTLSAVGVISIMGGDTDLVNALGGIGGNAWLVLSQSFQNFVPGLNVLVMDGNVFSTDFSVDLQGVLTPFNPSPFVPEPSTALLLGAGMLGMLGLSRRARRLR